MADTKEQIVLRLESLVNKVLVQTREAAEVEFRIFAPHTPAEPYIIELSKSRFFRRVPVDGNTIRRVAEGRPDAALMRDVRAAVLAVARHARRR